MEFDTPKRRALAGVAAVLVLFAAYAAFATWPHGDAVRVTIEAGVNGDGSQYYRCIRNESSPGVCDPAQANRVIVSKRDQVELTVRTDDGKPHSHDFHVLGWAYGPPYPWVEMELKTPSQTRTFTAWKAGTFRFVCDLPGHEAAGMWGTLVVQET